MQISLNKESHKKFSVSLGELKRSELLKSSVLCLLSNDSYIVCQCFLLINNFIKQFKQSIIYFGIFVVPKTPDFTDRQNLCQE